MYGCSVREVINAPQGAISAGSAAAKQLDSSQPVTGIDHTDSLHSLPVTFSLFSSNSQHGPADRNTQLQANAHPACTFLTFTHYWGLFFVHVEAMQRYFNTLQNLLLKGAIFQIFTVLNHKTSFRSGRTSCCVEVPAASISSLSFAPGLFLSPLSALHIVPLRQVQITRLWAVPDGTWSLPVVVAPRRWSYISLWERIKDDWSPGSATQDLTDHRIELPDFCDSSHFRLNGRWKFPAAWRAVSFQRGICRYHWGTQWAGIGALGDTTKGRVVQTETGRTYLEVIFGVIKDTGEWVGWAWGRGLSACHQCVVWETWMDSQQLPGPIREEAGDLFDPRRAFIRTDGGGQTSVITCEIFSWIHPLESHVNEAWIYWVLVHFAWSGWPHEEPEENTFYMGNVFMSVSFKCFTYVFISFVYIQ